MRIGTHAAAIVAAGLTVLGGTAAAAQSMDRNGYQAIVAGDYSHAAKQLEAERRIYPDRPELMLNLAAAYAQAGRAAEARALYRAVIRQPALDMDVVSGATVSSHAVAARGLARLGDVEQAAR
jgi:Flp pilus assembly protein TadD